LSTKIPLQAVPTNVITGFLGVGKTTAILNLLKNKPANERWAVLVNEFGEIGVDGSLMQGQYGQETGIFVREVPGGCMCCTSGLPMQIALNQLLVKAKPDRLLIEPTGLGHPKEVLEVLSAEYYQDVLSLHKTLTIVDARKLTDQRYTDHKTFNQQIATADRVVGNKIDLYEDKDKVRLNEYVKQHGQPHAEVIFTLNGEIPFVELHGETKTSFISSDHHHHKELKKTLANDAEIPEKGFLAAINGAEGFYSIGWRISPHKIFSYRQLFSFLTGLQVERMKAVFITDAGIFGYNLTADALTEIQLDECEESRIELISDELDDSLEDQLLNCVIA
jgi:G3E family GTPase